MTTLEARLARLDIEENVRTGIRRKDFNAVQIQCNGAGWRVIIHCGIKSFPSVRHPSLLNAYNDAEAQRLAARARAS